MALRPEFSLGHSEFNDFLFAAVGEEKSGIQLTVLSALSRLGFDPWLEAARLSSLPKDAASQALAATIAMLPEGDWKASDSWAIAVRLVNILPKRSAPAAPAAPSPQAAPKWRAEGKPRTAIWWVAALVVALLFALSVLL